MDATHETQAPLAKMVGLIPDLTGGACSVCYVRWQRDDELPHDDCRAALSEEWKP